MTPELTWMHGFSRPSCKTDARLGRLPSPKFMHSSFWLSCQPDWVYDKDNYFQAVLPEQFDEYIWFDRTNAVTPFATREIQDMPDIYPLGR